MLRLVFSALRTRWAQAVTVLLLSGIATAAAVAGPLALRVVDAAVVRNEVADATIAERTTTISGDANPSDPAATNTFQSFVSLLKQPGFTIINAGELWAFGPMPVPDKTSGGAGADISAQAGSEDASAVDPGPGFQSSTTRVAFRDDLCAHVTIVSGRCLAGALDIIVGADTAARNGVHTGDRVYLQAETPNPHNGQATPDGPVVILTVSGTYRPTNPDEIYWASHYYFPARADGTLDEASFVLPTTFDLVTHTSGGSFADGIPTAQAFTADRVGPLATSIRAAIQNAGNADSGFTLNTDIPNMVDRIQAGEALADELVPLAFLPLIGLSWYVVFLAVGYGVNARRTELGLVNLRGVRPVRRWSLATAEALLMIILGAPLGYLAGYAVVGAVARATLGGAQGAELGPGQAGYAAIALGGALLVAILGQRRAVAEPVVDLLRGVPSRNRAWRSYVGDVVLILLAVLGVIQLRGGGTGLTGVALVVPGLVLVAVTLLLARVFIPIARLVAAGALRRGLLGTGLAAVQIARRPGSQRLFTLIAVATGLLAFVAAGQSVAAQAREQRAAVTVGASAVVQIARAGTPALLTATHAVDPLGAWAMAVVPLKQADPTDPPVLAIDSARLGAVATWQPQFGATAQSVAQALRPPAVTPFVLRGSTFVLDAQRSQDTGQAIDTNGDGFPDTNVFHGTALNLTFVFQRLTDGAIVRVTVGLRAGRHEVTATTTQCADGCRLTGMTEVIGPQTFASIDIFGMHVPGGDDVIPLAGLTTKARWRSVGSTAVIARADRLEIIEGGSELDSGVITAVVVDAPTPVPLLSTRGVTVPEKILGLSGDPITVQGATTLKLLPRLGSNGVLVDLAYLQSDDIAVDGAQTSEVWLGPAAPADAVQRLRDAGLSILGESRIADTQAALDRSGPALALRFHIAAAVLGIGLALGGLWLVAAVDRRRRADDLRALRNQGLPRRFVRRAALWGYLWLVTGATVAGLAAAAAAWGLTGDHLPVLTDNVATLPPPRWPAVSAVLQPWAISAAVLIAVAVAAAVILRRSANATPRSR